ncbi:MAG: hypothetical protein R3B70_32435 [Polyangiaceae bacterium]
MAPPGRVFLAAAAALLVTAGCSIGGFPEIPNAPEGGGGNTSTPSTGVGGGGAGGGSSSGAGGDALAPVLVGISPTPASSAGMPAPVAEIEAELTTLAAGARAAVLVLPWDELAASDGADLAKIAAFYAGHGKRISISVAVVDRMVDRRPAALDGFAWSAPETITAMKATLDSLFEITGDEVRFVTFGRDADIYLQAHPDERAGFVAFAKAACAYIKVHPDAPADVEVGVGFTTEAPKNETAFKDLIDFQDVVAFSYFPGMSAPGQAAAADVASTVTKLADAAGKKRIVLTGAGLASDPVAGGSEDAQQKFFATLFGAVAARRESFALVNVVELNDAPDDACAAWAESQGDAPGGPLTAYACSMGLFRDDGTPRPAWSTVLSGSAALSTP